MTLFSMKHCQRQKAHSPPLYISQAKDRMSIFLVPFQQDSQAYFVHSFLLRGKIDFRLSVDHFAPFSPFLSCPGSVNHTIIIAYTQLKALVCGFHLSLSLNKPSNGIHSPSQLINSHCFPSVTYIGALARRLTQKSGASNLNSFLYG